MNDFNKENGLQSETREIVSRFFALLEKWGVESCVVGREVEFIGHPYGDIDLVVPEDKLRDIPSFLHTFCQQLKVQVVQVLQHEQTAFYYVVAWGAGHTTPRFVALDVCADYYRNGRLFLRATEILENRTPAFDKEGKKTGYYVPCSATEFIYYLLKKIDKQFLDDDHGSHLSAVWKKDPKRASAQIERFWSGQEAALLRHAAEDGDWAPVRRALPKLRRSIHKKLPASSLRAIIQELARKVRRVVQPTGLHVAFLGADGSGKSTVIEHAIAALAPAFRRTRYMHLRPAIGLGKGNGTPVLDPHGKPPRSWLVSVAKVFYFLFDYTVGWWVVVRPRLVRSTFVVFDRYYHDLLVDPLRYRYGGPMWLARWIGKLLPQPDLWILLDAPPEVLHARKQEVSTKETARQREAYLRLVQGMDNSVVVDASQPLDDVVREVNMRILDLMAARTARRLGLPDGDPRNVR